MAIEFGDPSLIWEETLRSTTVRMMKEISLKIDQHIIETVLRPAFEAGVTYGEDVATSVEWGYRNGEPGFDEWLPAFLSHFQGDVE